MDKYDNKHNFNFEPMEVDRSASSISKMDISSAASDSDVLIVDSKPQIFDVDDDFVQSYAKFRLPDDSPVSRPKSSTPLLKPPFIKIKQEPLDDSTADVQIKEEVVDNDNKSNITLQSNRLRKKPRTRSIKKYHIKLEHHERNVEHHERNVPPSKVKLTIIAAVILLLSVLMYKIMTLKCMELDLEMLETSFSNNLYGQPSASNRLIESLKMEDKSQIILLYGGTGVGKTYAVSMIMEQLWNSANLYHYTMSTFSERLSTELMVGLTLCGSSLLIVDDVSLENSQVVTQIENVLSKSEGVGKSILIILIYNCDRVTDGFIKKCDSSFVDDLSLHYKHIQTKKQFIKFQPLTENDLKKCIQKELGSRTVNHQEMNNIMKNFNVSFDGCKGVYKKIKFMNVK